MSDELESTLSNLNAEYEGLKAGEEQPDPEPAAELEEQPLEEPEYQEEPEESPASNYLTKDEWVAKGKDPDLYMSEKLFNAESARIQESIELKKELQSNAEMMRSTLDAMEVWKGDKDAEYREKLESALEKAKEDENIEDALAAQRKIDTLSQTTTQPKGMNPITVSFLAGNPIIDKNSSQFNQDVFQDMAKIQQVSIDRMSSLQGRDLSDAQLQRINVAAFDDAKKLNAHLFKSAPKRQLKAPSTQKRQVAAPRNTDSEDMRNTKIQNERGHPRNADQISELHAIIEKANPKRAAAFANTVRNLRGK